MSAPRVEPWFDRDPDAARITRRRFLERHCETDTLILTAHFPLPSIGHIVARDGAFMFRSS